MLQMSKLLRSRSIWRRKASERAEEVRELKKTKYKPSLAKPLLNANKIRALCVQFALQGVVSYRSIPRILRVFNFSKIQYNSWVPHFSSVINWLLRLGLGKLQLE